MKRIANYIEVEEACNSFYVTTDEIRTILGGVSKSKADNFRKTLENKLKAERLEALKEIDAKKRNELLARCFYFDDTRPHRIPIRRVLEEAHIDLDYVRREANKMRRAMKIEREMS